GGGLGGGGGGAAVPQGRRGGPAGPVPEVPPNRARVRVPVSWRGYRVLAVDTRPAVVVEAGSAADVAQAVRHARAHGMRIAPQGTGHGAEPLEPLEPLDGAMLLRTARMRKGRIDPATHTPRAEAGATWPRVPARGAGRGGAGRAGGPPPVGVVASPLGGGLGWLARRYGLAANSVTAAEVVTPGGDLVRADASHEPDLFWAIRGGG